MKKVACIPISSVSSVKIIVTECKKTLDQVKSETGADYILNGGMWSWGSDKACPHLMVDGVRLSDAPYPWWDAFGYHWTSGPDIALESSATALEKGGNFFSCTCLIGPWGPVASPGYDAAQGGRRGRSAVGIAGDKLGLYCAGDGTADASTPEELRDELHSLGWDSAVMLDGGGSAQCDFAGKTITASRKVHNWICVWLKKEAVDPPKEEKPMSKPIVCLDPGHGPGNVNGSPDGSYKEHEFTWDLCSRIKPLLEAQGVSVVLTRSKNTYPTQTDRAKTSNQAGADLFVSIHTNAVGGGGWSTPSGFVAFTSAGPKTAPRNLAAVDIINAVHKAGVTLFGTGTPYHNLYTVLTATTAPAVLLECGFHTNKQDVALLSDSGYRDKLAEAISDGIFDFLAIDPVEEPESGKPDQPSIWAEETWFKAVDKGVFDGTNPQGPLTREQASLVLDRLGLL